MRVRDGPAVALARRTDQPPILGCGARHPAARVSSGPYPTYEMRRLQVESRYVVNAEVSVLLHLLESVGLGEEIRRRYEPLRAPDELSPEERAALPERALKYIEKLEGEIAELEALHHRTQDRLRKANWAKWSR